VNLFQSVDRWIQSFKELTDNCALIYIVANKSDLLPRVENAEMMLVENETITQFFIISAQTGVGIDALFLELPMSPEPLSKRLGF
jgi:GTPase SAR1 family protein